MTDFHSTQSNLSFVSLDLGDEINQIWNLLNEKFLKSIDVSAFIENTKIGELERKNWRPILENILPIYPGMLWSTKEKKVVEPSFKPTIGAASVQDFLDASKQFFDQFSGKHIAVQLSGGLDSSLIISLLQHFNIPFSLIGMTSTRFEFRTEKYIQELYAPLGKNTILLDYEKYLPFSEIENVPPHQYPDLFSLNYAANKAMAIACEKIGVEVLFTGSGGDNVFAEPISYNPEECTWSPKGFIEGWLADLIYKPSGVALIPFYADTEILNVLYNLRIGAKEDNYKLWARSFFKDLLPDELVNYSYCADFWGLYISGLQNALPRIQSLCKEAYRITKNANFSENNIEKLLSNNILDAKKSLNQEIESITAVAVWLNSLKNFRA